MIHLHPARYEYAKNVLALGYGFDRPGAPALFDAAVTNGLVAIVASEWPGSEASNGRTLAATKLLEVIEERASAKDVGIHTLVPDPSFSVDIKVAVLRKAVIDLQPLRHGRGGDAYVAPDAVFALRELDQHPALQCLTYEEVDDREMREIARDGEARDSAKRYLEMLSDHEIARRVAAVDDALPLLPVL